MRSIRGALLWPSSDLSQDAGLRARISLDGFYLGPRDDTLCCSHLCGPESEEDETRPTERCGATPRCRGERPPLGSRGGAGEARARAGVRVSALREQTPGARSWHRLGSRVLGRSACSLIHSVSRFRCKIKSCPGSSDVLNSQERDGLPLLRKLIRSIERR